MTRSKAKAKKKNQNKQNKEQSNDQNQQQADPVRAVIAVTADLVALAVGKQLRVLDRSSGTVTTVQDNTAPIRGVAFDPTGKYLLSGGDDKTFYLWDCASWKCLESWKSPKKISAVAFTLDSNAMLAADKFGDVLVAKQGTKNPEELLGHFCSIVTHISLSHDGKLVATTDRDHRVRVSILPSPDVILKGAPEIQSYCFGHTSYVTCAAFTKQGDEELLVSGGGDGTLRLWNPQDGTLLDTLHIDSNDGNTADDNNNSASGSTTPAVVSLATSPNGNHVVAVIDARPEIFVAKIDHAAKKLHKCETSTALDGMPLPTDVAIDTQHGIFWIAGGPATQESNAAFLACATVDDNGKLTLDNGCWSGKTLLEGDVPKDTQPGQSFIASYLRKHVGGKRKRQGGDEDEGGEQEEAPEDQEES